MDRRDFIIKAGATALVAGAGGRAFGAPGSAVKASDAQLSTTAAQAKLQMLKRLCRKRPNVKDLTAAQLTALKAGVTAMKARPASDPTSWSYQAGIHGSNAANQLPLFGTCQHGTLHFLSWHRYYLYYFERILRAASGSSTLMLPYWDWTADRAVPAPFRDSAGGNPLYVSQRASGINGGALLPASAVTPTAALGTTAFNSFTGTIEGTPHGSVHVSVGGWMSSFNTAGQDPIFWLHHANIDRLWEAWLAQGGGRANPADAGWRNTQFQFFDEHGTMRTVKAGGALSTCNSFGYNYTGDRVIFPVLAQILATQVSDEVAKSIQHRGAVDTAPSLSLGGRAASATVAVPRATGAVAQRTYLAFDDVEVANPEGYYEIYLNPKEGAKLAFTDPSYAGNLVLFGLAAGDRHAGHGAMAAMPARRVFDITRKVAALAKTPGFDAAQLRVVLVLKTAGATPVGAVETPRARVGKVHVIVQ